MTVSVLTKREAKKLEKQLAKNKGWKLYHTT
jgi:hypothetical protein